MKQNETISNKLEWGTNFIQIIYVVESIAKQKLREINAPEEKVIDPTLK